MCRDFSYHRRLSQQENFRDLVLIGHSGFHQTLQMNQELRPTPEALSRKLSSDMLLKILDDHLVSNHFVAGNEFTFGDIPLGVLIHKYFVLDIERPSLPGIEAWYQRLTNRPPFQEHAMQPFGNSPSEFFALQTKGEENE